MKVLFYVKLQALSIFSLNFKSYMPHHLHLRTIQIHPDFHNIHIIYKQQVIQICPSRLLIRIYFGKERTKFRRTNV